MARLIIVTHELDLFAYRDPKAGGRVTTSYLLFGLLKYVKALGHTWRVAAGPRAESGDVAILHVDSTFVGEDYLALASHYAGTINFGTGDISKRRISSQLLQNGDSWDGPVIVKSNLNSGASIEHVQNQRARLRGLPLPHPGVKRHSDYRVLDSIAEVEDAVWEDPDLVVERFLPEPNPDGGYVLRTWVFMASRERCTRMVTPRYICKASEVVRYDAAEVPPKLRLERERLGFDFGKFDFVMHEGEPVLLDANRTPGVANAIGELMRSGEPILAQGLDELIRGRC